MSKNARLASLKKSHAKLEDQIHQAEMKPGYDQLEISQMKRQKLYIKDEMEALRG
jgi:hypothetical protein